MDLGQGEGGGLLYGGLYARARPTIKLKPVSLFFPGRHGFGSKFLPAGRTVTLIRRKGHPDLNNMHMGPFPDLFGVDNSFSGSHQFKASCFKMLAISLEHQGEGFESGM